MSLKYIVHNGGKKTKKRKVETSNRRKTTTGGEKISNGGGQRENMQVLVERRIASIVVPSEGETIWPSKNLLGPGVGRRGPETSD